MDATVDSPGQTAAPLAAATPPAIVVEGVRKSYRGAVALRPLDLSVEPGTVLGLLGPNGAGKTTLIRILSTVLAPDAGAFQVAGASGDDPQSIRRRIGVLPESAGYPRVQSCEEWVTYHGRLFGLERREARDRARRLLEDVGLAERRRSLIAGLSRGMRQRLGIARALVNDPQVLFLDEPTLGLDPRGQRQVLDLITRIARDRGVTVVLSTHVLDEVEQICDRVVILNRGRVVADGTMAEVVRRAAAPRRGVVQVPTHLRERAVALLAQHGMVRDGSTPAGNGHHGAVEVLLAPDRPPEDASAAALRVLLDDGVPVLGYTLEGGRLNDAFLAVTEPGGETDD